MLSLLLIHLVRQIFGTKIGTKGVITVMLNTTIRPSGDIYRFNILNFGMTISRYEIILMKIELRTESEVWCFLFWTLP